MTNDNLDGKLDAVFQSYRNACPDVEGSSNFMPQLWQKIEARQPGPFVWRRFTRVFVSTAAAMCLGMSLLLLVPSQGSGVLVSYVEALDHAHSHEALVYADVDPDGEDSPWR